MSEIDPSEETKKLPLAPNTIETIDGAFLDYVEKLNLYCETMNGRTKVPVIWSSAERSFQVKDNFAIRDRDGSLIPPIISLERVSITKDPKNKGSFQAGVSPGHDRYYITKLLNQDKTSNFANADTKRKSGQLNFQTSKKNRKIVYQHIELRMPVYVTVEYKINILTNYQAQMNEIIQPFVALTAQNYFIIEKDDYRFESFMDPSFSQDSIADLGEEERKYKTTITVKVLGQIIGEGLNKTGRTAEIVENGFLKIPKENIILDTPTGQEQVRRKEISSGLSTGVGGGTSTGGDIQIVAPLKKTFLIGNGVDTLYEIRHNLGSKDLLVSMRENFGLFQKVEFYCEFENENTLLVDTGDPISEDSYTVVIMDGMANADTSGSIGLWQQAGGYITTNNSVYMTSSVLETASINQTNILSASIQNAYFSTYARGIVNSVTSSANTLTLNLDSANYFLHNVTEDTTLALPQNPVAGQSGLIVFVQGNPVRSLAYSSFWKFPAGITGSLSAVTSSIDVLSYFVVSSSYAVCNMSKGYA
jgi:hypothetical protein